MEDAQMMLVGRRISPEDVEGPGFTDFGDIWIHTTTRLYNCLPNQSEITVEHSLSRGRGTADFPSLQRSSIRP